MNEETLSRLAGREIAERLSIGPIQKRRPPAMGTAFRGRPAAAPRCRRGSS